MHWFEFSIRDFSVSFLSILFEGVPFMFIGTLLSGLIDAFVSAEALERRLPRNRFVAIGFSGLLGAVLPMCECGIVPVIRRMIKKGYPVSAALTYLLAAPIVNPIVAASTFAAFRGQHPGIVMSLRLTLGFSVAILVGWVVERIPVKRVLNRTMLAALPRDSQKSAQVPVHTGEKSMKFEFIGKAPQRPQGFAPAEAQRGRQRGIGGKLLGAVRCAGADFLDVAFYLVIGAAITSVFNTAINKSFVAPLAGNAGVATLCMMILAMLLSLCSTSDAFIAANFTGFPLAAKLAFMVLGPMMDIKLLFMYGLVFRKRFTFALAAGLCLVIGVASVAVCYLLKP